MNTATPVIDPDFVLTQQEADAVHLYQNAPYTDERFGDMATVNLFATFYTDTGKAVPVPSRNVAEAIDQYHINRDSRGLDALLAECVDTVTRMFDRAKFDCEPVA